MMLSLDLCEDQKEAAKIYHLIIWKAWQAAMSFFVFLCTMFTVIPPTDAFKVFVVNSHTNVTFVLSKHALTL